MDLNQSGFGTQQNTNNYGNMPYNMPKFIPHDVWIREKKRLSRLSALAGGAVLLYILFSFAFSGIYLMINDVMASVGGSAYDVFTKVTETNEFLFIFEMLYSVFVVGGPFFALGFIYYKKGLVGSIPMGKPLKAKLLPLIVVAGFGLCLFGNIINSYITVFFELFTGDKLEYSITPEIPTTAFGIVLFYFGTAVVPALIEEFALRGIIMQPLRRYGDWFAIICSALVFSLMHCNLVQIPFAFIAGVVIGYAVIMTESVWTGVIIHFMNNAFSVTVNIIYEFYGMDSWQYKLCDSVFYVVMIVGAVMAYFVVKKINDKPLYKSSLINQGKNIYGQVHPYSARISNKTLYCTYLITVPMISAFVVVCYETVVALANF